MKRIFYNNMMKKLLVSIFLVMIITSSLIPNVVFAATEKIEHFDYSFSYKDWLDLSNKNGYKDIIEKYGSEKYKSELKNIVIDALCKTVFFEKNAGNPDEAKKLAENLTSSNPEGIMVNGTLKIGTNLFGGVVCKFEIKTKKNEYGQNVPEVALKENAHENVTEQTMKYNELLEWSGKTEGNLDKEIIKLIKDDFFAGVDILEGDATPEDVAKKILELNKEAIVLTVVGNKDNHTITDFEVPGKDENTLKIEAGKALGIPTAEDDDTGDLGGWLLEPVFMLVNFVFDSLTSILGEVMNGQDGFLYTKTEPTIDISTLTYKDVVRVNVAPFGLGHVYHTVTYTPEEIFSGKIDLLSIDFISGNKADGTAVTDDGWLNIRTVIAQWYKVLRMIAIIGLLSVLIYTGIKIIISANAKDKAKYKEWIINWFIAVAILFSMHYIMAFITSVTGEFSTLLNEANGKVIVEEVDSEAEIGNETVNTGKLFETNLMGLVRFRIQTNNMGEKIAYEVMYIALFIYTVKFTFVYLKRVLNMAFLTLIAPIVALTYPIDKLNDGNAQGFNMWLKEYIFNALLQPMHLIMYYILVGSAVSIAASNPLYGIVVLAFMTEAEKLLKKIFGFDKASGGTVGGMAGAFAAGALASSVKNIAKLAGKGSGGNGGKGDAISQKNDMFDNPKPTAGLDVEKDFGSDDDKTTEQKMFEADEENGEFDDDPERRETLARDGEATPESRYKDENDYYAQQREEMLALGASEEEVDQQMMDQYGETGRNETTQEANEKPVDQGTPIAEMAANKDEQNKEKKESKKKSKFLKGMAGVGKTLAKPVWDFNHGAAYNGKRLARKIGRAALGAGVGLTAAAVQAGISITDGKYNPMEGIATFTAGYAGGGQIAKGIGNLGSAYTQGALQGDKTAIMERAKKRWKDRDDVIAFNKANYKPEEIKEITRIQSEHLLQYGFDLKEMKSVTKYAQQLQKNNPKMSEEAVYNQAAKTLKLKQEVEDRMKGASYDASKQEKYINTMLKGKTGDEKAKLEKAYRNGFKSILAFDEANS